MGLKISYSDEFGNTNAEAYIKIVKAEELYELNGQVRVGVDAGLFKDKASRDASKRPLLYIHISALDTEELSRADLYAALKLELISQGFVEDAEDITDILEE